MDRIDRAIRRVIMHAAATENPYSEWEEDYGETEEEEEVDEQDD